ncbi:SDR family oxidoreductase, partial [Alphaproteobacteria bacterium]|nr:SDR family oxidoreductase [Alphaproteobacteria bacterium]
VLITGASKGLGSNFAKVLANDGFRIIGVGRNKDDLKKVISELPNSKLNHDYLVLDITDENQVQEKLKNIQIYGLVNNAGIANTKLLHEETYEDINRIVNTNLIGSLNVSKAIIPNMIQNKCGRIVNIASALGHRPLSYVGAYSATKAALIQVTKSQSIELARYNIYVNAIAPGYIMTDINRHQLEGEAGEILKKKIPLRRFGDINELDLLISMLLNKKNSYMTGSIISIDGGLSAGL